MSFLVGRLLFVIFDGTGAADRDRLLEGGGAVTVRVETAAGVWLADGWVVGSMDVGSIELGSVGLGVVVLGWAVRAGIAVRCVPRLRR
jgi:hypothetical protein